MRFSTERMGLFILAKSICIALCLCLTNISVYAQPSNDNCSNASSIVIANGGFATGIFTSSTDDISSATIQTGEIFAPAIIVAGQNKKSIWYKFSLPTTRTARVTLAQNGTAIAAGDAGFAVYKINGCVPALDSLSTKLTPIATFGNTYHPCVDPGDYLVQVSSNSKANGPLYVQLQLSDSTGALYDHPIQAYKFGKLSSFINNVDYPVQCQSIEDANEVCSTLSNYKQYTKSTWHTFTTPAYFDYVSVMVAGSTGYFTGNVINKVGYTLYEGDATTTPYITLNKIDGCDSLLTNGYQPDYRVYKCSELKPNTTYTVQLFFKQTFNENLRVALVYGGTKPTQAPEPILSKVPASNLFGNLAMNGAGILTTKSDQFACNSQHSLHPCSPSLPAAGVKVNGVNYNLSSFFTFNLTSTAKIDLSASRGNCGYYFGILIRLYKQNLSENCNSLDTANLVGQFLNNSSFDCLSPGTYTVQVLGTDTLLPKNYIYYGYLTQSASPFCYLFNNFADGFNLSVRGYTRNALNDFSLSTAGGIDTINRVGNTMQTLKDGIQYKANVDTFGCQNTLRPPDTTCNPINNKVMYRLFAVADSGIVTFTNLTYPFQYHLYQGDASALASAQNVNAFPSRISGLNPITKCMYYNTTCAGEKVCVTPGTYTFTTFASDNEIGRFDQPNLRFNLVSTQHFSPQTAQDLGNLLDTLTKKGTSSIASDVDYFSCKDNAVPINGYQPCTLSTAPSTKAIYRQFYLSDAAQVTINYTSACNYGGIMTLFSGKASDGLAGLTPMPSPWRCFYNATVPDKCKPLDAGWYTVVSYGSGPTYANPMQDVSQNGYGSYIGLANQFTISVTKACPGPKYNRPYKAAVDTLTKQPYLIQWKSRKGSTAAYPFTDTTYTLYTENFNCTLDTPFSARPIQTCNSSLNRVAYYVFTTTQESYVQITTQSYWAQVLAGDARKDSASFGTAIPIQPCTNQNGYIQICKLQPGTYTLVVFAADVNSCTGVTPSIYIDQVGYSRFDHANNAYDFGVVPTDSLYHNGKVGDVNPLNSGRAPSNDFFYCTTGARKSDPTNMSCGVDYNPAIYNPGVNNFLYTDSLAKAQGATIIPRRNLWYTFVVDKGGWVYVRVKNKTINKPYQYGFGVYKTNEDGTLPFSTLVSTGRVDSTIAQGLSFTAQNAVYYYCRDRPDFVRFYRDPCSSGTDRYYIVVENANSYPYEYPAGMNPNSQVEVEVMVDSIDAVQPKFDHYYTASDMGVLSPGKYKGVTDNYSCATFDTKDPVYYGYNTCAKKTLWYKFTCAVTGHIRFQTTVNGVTKEYSYSDIHLLKEMIPGDSTTKSLVIANGSNTAYYNPATGSYWGQQCISPGTYYLLLTGCSKLNEYVYPEIEILEDAGDFCSAPVVSTLNGAGSKITSVIVDCHTIGTDYGEFNPLLTCPAGAKKEDYKSSWFRLDVTGKDTLDVTAFLNEQTTATSTEIKYRMMTGNCGAMQEQSCVQDALTQNTYKCLAPGSYYIQVFTPVLKNGVPVTGNIDLNLKAIIHADTCAPIKKCLANANFNTQFDCKTDTAVRFVNFSTYGSAIINKWDFGYQNKTSTDVSPSFYYPALARDTVYNVKLFIENTTCGEKDSVTIAVTVPGRPVVRLGNDTTLCKVASRVLDATSWTGSTYAWNTGATTKTITSSSPGIYTYSVKVSYNGCAAVDTIVVKQNPITPQKTSSFLCSSFDSVSLNSNRGQSETYAWSTGATTYVIYAKAGGLYTDSVKWQGCAVVDSFTIVAVADALPTDTSLCLKQPAILNVTAPNALSYTWSNGTNKPTLSITAAGQYWVQTNYQNCSRRDTVIVTALQPIVRNTAAAICSGQTYTLPSGVAVATAGTYADTARTKGGCDSVISLVVLSVKQRTVQATSVSICAGQTFTLASGRVVNTSGIYLDTIRYALGGCDSIIRSVTLSVKSVTTIITSASICAGQTYTLPSGASVSQTGVYKDTIRYATGCDSMVTTLTLGVSANTSITRNIVICLGQSYTLPTGKLASTSGTYIDTTKHANICDSIITTVLVVKNVSINTVSPVICQGQTYTLPSGVIINATGTYRDTLRYAGGCDSIRTTVNLTVNAVVLKTINTAICQGSTYTLPSGKIVNTAGIYKDTIKYAGGCDSLITSVTLKVNSLTTAAIDKTICDGQSYTMPSGNVATIAGTYKDTVRGSAGCDSIISLIRLSVSTTRVINKDAFICFGNSYKMPSGLVVNNAGIYRDTLRTSIGCDSVINVVRLSVGVATAVNINTSICSGQSYTMPRGVVIKNTGTYMDTLKSSAGCDSLITTVNLNVQTTSIVNLNAFICAGQNYILPSGKRVSTTGLYRDTLRYATGCDSLISIVNLKVQVATLVSTNAAICDGQTYTLPSGKVLSIAGKYNDTLRYTSGCDSVLTIVNLQVQKATAVNLNASLCAGQIYKMPSGIIRNTSGIYKDTLRSTRGCDSLITTVNLTVQSPVFVAISSTVCAGQSYTMPAGKVVAITGTYKDTLRGSLGCDSLITTVRLSLKSVSKVNFAFTICEGTTYILPSGKLVRTSGVYNDTLHYASGCDSIITTINLTVKPVSRSSATVTICSGKTYTLPSGKIINTAGAYRDTLRYVNGCDSIITQLNLNVTVPVIFNRNANICVGDSYQLPSGMMANTTGVYRDTLRTFTGCDSLITVVNLTVNPLPVITLSKSGDIDCLIGTAQLSAAGGGRYLWSPAASLSSASIYNPIAFPSATTMYKVQVTSSRGCVTLDSIQVKVITGDPQGGFLLPSAFTPNGDGKNDCFGVVSWGIVNNLNFTVLDRWGLIVFATTDPSRCWDGTYKGEKLGTAAFVYQISASTICGTIYRKGQVMLIR